MLEDHSTSSKDLPVCSVSQENYWYLFDTICTSVQEVGDIVYTQYQNGETTAELFITIEFYSSSEFSNNAITEYIKEQYGVNLFIHGWSYSEMIHDVYGLTMHFYER